MVTYGNVTVAALNFLGFMWLLHDRFYGYCGDILITYGNVTLALLNFVVFYVIVPSEIRTLINFFFF